ncbi:MAG: hypothetical protein ACI8RD_006725 [Bacillariaceae sp.]|jgi:hypothetical protein
MNNNNNNKCIVAVAVMVLLLCISSSPSDAFTTNTVSPQGRTFLSRQNTIKPTLLAASSSGDSTLTRVPEDDEGVAIPFLDRTENSFIECYADSIITVDDIEYTIGVPCDYCVALCYFDDKQNLIPVELNDDLMDDIFPFAESIVSEEFEEELVLQRTPQTLTLVGELEDDDIDEDDEDEDDEEEDEEYNGEDEVEVLLTFEHRDKEYNLVRLMDPVLLVGKVDSERPDLRVLLTPDESEKIMPQLETAFLKYHEEDGPNSILP